MVSIRKLERGCCARAVLVLRGGQGWRHEEGMKSTDWALRQKGERR